MGNRLSKIYTRTGDTGSTGLGAGSVTGCAAAGVALAFSLESAPRVSRVSNTGPDPGGGANFATSAMSSLSRLLNAGSLYTSTAPFFTTAASVPEAMSALAGGRFDAILPPDGLNDWNDAIRALTPAP